MVYNKALAMESPLDGKTTASPTPSSNFYFMFLDFSCGFFCCFFCVCFVWGFVFFFLYCFIACNGRDYGLMKFGNYINRNIYIVI